MQLDSNIEDELKENQYLGTFRWKNPKLNKLEQINLNDITFNFSNYLISYQTSWKTFLDLRFKDEEFEASMIDALSYPLSIIQIIDKMISMKLLDNIALIKKSILQNSKIKNKTTLNIILIGASKKTEERIALQSNYFDEIYYFLLCYIYSLCIDDKEREVIYNTFSLNICFTGEEVSTNNSYTSQVNSKINYSFYSLKTYEFLKENSLDFTKSNSIIIGLNCGFGAGYQKLTLSWIKDLQLLLKMNYICGFTFTNDYEDQKGEIEIMKYLTAKVKYLCESNQFKSMSIYKNESEEDAWSCGNHGFYIVQGCDKLITVNDDEVIAILKSNKLLK